MQKYPLFTNMMAYEESMPNQFSHVINKFIVYHQDNKIIL